MDQVKLSQDRSSQVVTGQVNSELFLDPKYCWTQIVFSLLVSQNLWLTISCVQSSLKLNFFWKRKVLDTRRLWPKNFSKRDEVDSLTVEYFESSLNLENLELECGPAQPDLFSIFVWNTSSLIFYNDDISRLLHWINKSEFQGQTHRQTHRHIRRSIIIRKRKVFGTMSLI